tara:strand:+ start:22 stop:267 length:246 start_codon:yes stop_codon:yes gene_type:complete
MREEETDYEGKQIGSASQFTAVKGLPNDTAILIPKEHVEKMAIFMEEMPDKGLNTLGKLLRLSSGVMALVPESGVWPWENE